VWLEGTETAVVIEDLIGTSTGQVEGRIVEHVPRADQSPAPELVAKTDDSGLAIESTGVCLMQRNRHQGRVVRAPHTTSHRVREGELSG
jgi:hypothetical protein